MAGATRINIDKAGGLISGPGSSNVFVNNNPVSVIGDSVLPHTPKDTLHELPHTMISASSTVFANGKPICRAGDKSSCGHTASGSSNVNIG